MCMQSLVVCFAAASTDMYCCSLQVAFPQSLLFYIVSSKGRICANFGVGRHPVCAHLQSPNTQHSLLSFRVPGWGKAMDRVHVRSAFLHACWHKTSSHTLTWWPSPSNEHAGLHPLFLISQVSSSWHKMSLAFSHLVAASAIAFAHQRPRTCLI